jgi:hypothetical protein
MSCQQQTVFGQLHTILHFTAAAAATTVAQLFAAMVTVRVTSSAVPYGALLLLLLLLWALYIWTWPRQSTAYPPWRIISGQEGPPVDLIDRLSYQHLRGYHSVRANI